MPPPIPGPRPLRPEEALLNHLSLPAKLPQRQEHNIDGIETALCELLVNAAKTERDLPEQPKPSLWDSITRSLIASRKFVADGGRLERTSLMSELRHVAESESGFLFLHIRTHNAALLVQRSST